MGDRPRLRSSIKSKQRSREAQHRVLTRSTNAGAVLYFVQRAEYRNCFKGKLLILPRFGVPDY
jgi:hypothetical protein